MESRLAAMIAVALLTAATPVVALELPKPFSATYVGRPYMVGKLVVVITLERSGDRLKYTMRSKASAPFYRNEFYECSVLALRGDRIYPLEYKHTDKNNAAKNLTGRFDWNTNTATVTRADGKETRITGLVWPVWDPLSLQVGIMNDLLNGKFGTEKVYRVLDRNGVRDRRLRLAGDEEIETATAPKAIKIERTDGKPERLWFASDYDYMPVRIELKGVRVDLASDPTNEVRGDVLPDRQISGC